MSIHVDIIAVLSQARSERGWPQGAFQLYRRHCATRIQHLRKRLNLVSNAVFEKRELSEPPQSLLIGDEPTAAELENAQLYVMLVLFEAERAWAHAMESKSEGTPRRVLHAVKKMNRAVQYSQSLLKLCSGTARTWPVSLLTQVQAQAYATWIEGLVHFERQLDWNKAHENLLRAKELFTQMAPQCAFGTELLCRQFTDEIDSALRFCAYQLEIAGLPVPTTDFHAANSAFGAEHVETMFPTLEWHKQSILVRDSAIAHRLNKINQKQSALSQCTDNANKRFWIRRHLKSTYADAANLASRLCASYQGPSHVDNTNTNTALEIAALAEYFEYHHCVLATEELWERMLQAHNRLCTGRENMERLASLLPSQTGQSAGTELSQTAPADVAYIAGEIVQQLSVLSDPAAEASKGYVQALQLCFLGAQFESENFFAEALARYQHAFAVLSNTSKSVAETNALAQLMHCKSGRDVLLEFLSKRLAQSVLENTEAASPTSGLVTFPPTVAAMSAKPISFDLAYYRLADALPIRTSALPSKGLVGGLLSSLWSR